MSKRYYVNLNKLRSSSVLLRDAYCSLNCSQDEIVHPDKKQQINKKA